MRKSKKSTFTEPYKALCERLVAIRQAAGFTQRALAAKLGREMSFVARIELGERRVDVLELYWILKACKVKPDRLAAEIMRLFERMERKSK